MTFETVESCFDIKSKVEILDEKPDITSAQKKSECAYREYALNYCLVLLLLKNIIDIYADPLSRGILHNLLILTK